MNFNDTPEEAAFRAEVRAWLEKNAPKGQTSLRRTSSAPSEAESLAAAREWQAKKYEAGYAAITWPKEDGGRGGTPIQQVIYRQEEAHFPVNIDNFFGIGLSMCVPIVRLYGTPEHRTRYLRPGLRGDEIWAQLFSEPAGGSDLAAVRTKAERDGDDWIVNGQKIWTTGAHYCDFGIILIRTNPRVPKHKGLTMFIVDLKAPGVTIRPIKQLNGLSEFNEIFFENVRIPDSDRLGAEGQGWQVAISTLMLERNSVGAGLGFIEHDFMLDLARRATLGGKPAIHDGRIRERIADMYLNTRALRLLSHRAQTALSRGETPGPEQSITKAVEAIQGQGASYLAMDLMDQAGMLTAKDLGPDWAKVERSWTWGAAMRIAGGSDEILRNIIAERVLGLPQDIRTDKDIPFDELPA